MVNKKEIQLISDASNGGIKGESKTLETEDSRASMLSSDTNKASQVRVCNIVLKFYRSPISRRKEFHPKII